VIRRIGVDAQCRLLATSSEDKTVRLWSMPEGKLLRTQRLPIGRNSDGRIFATAISPDGRLVAAGGWDAGANLSNNNHGVYLFDSDTGTSMRRLGPFPNIINHVVFSLDGKQLAVGLKDGKGIRVLDVASGRELLADADYGGQDAFGLAFAADGSLFAVGYDGQLRRYRRHQQRSRQRCLVA